jgi:hypothetical protein
MSEEVPILVYTHSEYSFMWDAMIPLLKKHAKDIEIHWLYEKNADKTLIEKYLPNDWIKHEYDESDIWTKRVGKCLENINSEYILFLHEDWLPIGDLSKDILKHMVYFMKSVNCGFLLSYSHISTVNRGINVYSGIGDYYFYPEQNHIFQPAIWKKSVFQDFCNILNKSKHENEDNDCLNFMGARNCWSVQNSKTVTTLRTTNSLFYPHMHALSEGLWNFKKYPSLKQFLESFGINTETRGIHTWWELDTQ